MESNDAAKWHDANQSLRRVNQSRAKLAQRVTTPWWYKFGAALAVFTVFLAIGLVTSGPGTGTNEFAGNLAIILGAAIAPAVLLVALKRTTGVATDRYAKDSEWWYAVVFGLLIVAFVLQSYIGVPFALILAGLLAFVATLIRERYIDTVQRRRFTRPGIEDSTNG